MWRRSLPRITALAVAIALGAALAGTVRAEPFVEVSRHGSRFSVDASGVSVAIVLAALGREAGFQVQDSRPDAQRPPVDIALVDATLQQTLTRLLDRQNHLIVYREVVVEAAAGDTHDAIERIVLLGPRVEAARGAAPANRAATSPLAGPVVAPARPSVPPATSPPMPGAAGVNATGATAPGAGAPATEPLDQATGDPAASAAFRYTPEQLEAMRSAGLAVGAQGVPLPDADGDGQPDPPPEDPYPPIGQSLIRP